MSIQSSGYEIRELSEDEKTLTGRANRCRYPFAELTIGGPALIIPVAEAKEREGSIRASSAMWSKNQTLKQGKKVRLYCTKNRATGELLITRVE